MRYSSNVDMTSYKDGVRETHNTNLDGTGGPDARTGQPAGQLTRVHFSDCLFIVYPPTVTCIQGLTLVHFSDQLKHFLWDKLGGVSVTRLVHKTAQVELKSGDWCEALADGVGRRPQRVAPLRQRGMQPACVASSALVRAG